MKKRLWIVLAIAMLALPALAADRFGAPRITERTAPPAEPAPVPAEELAAPQITGIGGSDAAQLIAWNADDADVARAVRAVAAFLDLAPPQVDALVQLLGARRQAAQPVIVEIVKRERVIRELLEQGGDPAVVGRLLFEIRALHGRLAEIQAAFLQGFEETLFPEQREKMAALRFAARLQPALPPFAALSLL